MKRIFLTVALANGKHCPAIARQMIKVMKMENGC